MKRAVPENDRAQLRRSEELLRAIIQGTAAVTGTEFFRSLVRHLAEGLHVRWAFVAECLPSLRARSLAFWQDERFGEDFEYALPGTPCMEVAQGRVCHVPERLAQLFPEDRGMIDMGTMSYLGVPLINSEKRIIGHLVVFDDKPMPADALALSVMETFAARAGAELERKQADEEARGLREELAARKLAEIERERQRISDQLQQTGDALAASEERFRDLFDEAPIAYVNEGLDSRFIKANRAAMRTLGITPEQVEGTYGRDFVPNTPEAQRRLKEAFDSIGRGTDTSGVVLELRRRDNGKPLWIQWWSKPDAGGKFTRTMFVDITERVLMEQEKARLEAQNTYLQEEIRNEHNFGEIVGSSPALLAVLQQVEQIAKIDSTVLILGETGTGKELIARAIHDRSPRKNRALVKVNCGAISAGLVESELFGHVKGAFTGAIANRDGRFKLADGGTIFLDEAGELPMDTQVKLLRVLQEQEFEPIGSSKTIKVNVRIVTATNRDLEELVREGKFRADLFYRLNVFPIHTPPLRERVEEIPQLVTFFVGRFARRFANAAERVSSETMDRLVNYSWPGNVRELQNVVERAVVLATGPMLEIGPELLGTGKGAGREAVIASPPPEPGGRGLDDVLKDVETRHVRAALEQAGWVIEGARGAARILGLHPNTLRSRIEKLGIRRSDPRVS